MAEDKPSLPITVHKDPTLWLLLMDFAILVLPELDKQIQTGTLNWGTISHVIIQALIAFLRLRAADVVTGIKLFDKE